MPSLSVRDIDQETLDAYTRRVAMLHGSREAALRAHIQSEAERQLFSERKLFPRASDLVPAMTEEARGQFDRLWQARLIGYPLSESRYMPDDMWPEMPAMLRMAADVGGYDGVQRSAVLGLAARCEARPDRPLRPLFNDARCGPHVPMIPKTLPAADVAAILADLDGAPDGQACRLLYLELVRVCVRTIHRLFKLEDEALEVAL